MPWSKHAAETSGSLCLRHEGAFLGRSFFTSSSGRGPEEWTLGVHLGDFFHQQQGQHKGSILAWYFLDDLMIFFGGETTQCLGQHLVVSFRGSPWLKDLKGKVVEVYRLLDGWSWPPPKKTVYDGSQDVYSPVTASVLESLLAEHKLWEHVVFWNSDYSVLTVYFSIICLALRIPGLKGSMD